eukprot:s4612_g1.t1
MPADSKEFLLVEKGLLKVEGLVDDSWDEKDPVQSVYLFAKLKRFNLDLVKATFSTVESSRELTETARSLVSFARAIAEELLGDTQLEKTIKQAARLLEVCYQNLRYYQHDEMFQCATKFLLLIAPLEDLEQKLWKIKPKHHAMLEMQCIRA